MLIFWHLPKSCGTSLRRVLVEVYGQDRVGFQLTGKPTGELIDWHGKPIEERSCRAVGGHLVLSEWLYRHPGAQVVTLCRHPVDRLVSLWHWTRRQCGQNQGPFEDFAARPEVVRERANLLGGATLLPEWLYPSEPFAPQLRRMSYELDWPAVAAFRANAQQYETPVADRWESAVREMYPDEWEAYETAQRRYVDALAKR